MTIISCSPTLLTTFEVRSYSTLQLIVHTKSGIIFNRICIVQQHILNHIYFNVGESSQPGCRYSPKVGVNVP